MLDSAEINRDNMNAKKAKKLRRELRSMLSAEVLAKEAKQVRTNASGTVVVAPDSFRGCYNIVKKAFNK